MQLTKVLFDPMHLLFLGVVRTFICYYVNHRLVDEVMLSNFLSSVKVPACFKRKPRSMSIRHQFKAAEWRHLILHYHACVFFCCDAAQIRTHSVLLATFIRILMKCDISRRDCDDSKTLIKAFRELSASVFGEASCSFSMHALEHLPEQTLHFRALWNVSAATFESCFYELKKLVSGTRNEGKLVVQRFLRQKSMVDKRCETSNIDTVRVCGSLVTLNVQTISMLSCVYDFEVQESDEFAYDRFFSKSIVFHSWNYPHRKTSASCYAILTDDRFVRIDHILKRI